MQREKYRIKYMHLRSNDKYLTNKMPSHINDEIN